MKDFLRRFFASPWGPVLCGAVIGIVSPLLVKAGNPGNMGVCVVCFGRDTAGALGLHRAAPVQYIRPELAGIVLGALGAALVSGEFRSRTGSAPLVRFLLGGFSSGGALVFLGCPWRGWLRLSGGDGNALVGLAGLVAGVVLAVLFQRKGFSLGRRQPASGGLGWLMPALAAGLLVLLFRGPQFGREPGSGPIFFSSKGPGSQHAPAAIALGAGLLFGLLAQRSRFCTIGGIRDYFLMRELHLLRGILAMVAAAFVMNLLTGQFRAGFKEQPIAHTEAIWNFAGMALSGMAFTLAGGCPGRQLVLAGEGDGDAGVFILGLFAGTAFAHNFNLAASPAGVGPYGAAAVTVGLAFCVFTGMAFREKGEKA